MVQDILNKPAFSFLMSRVVLIFLLFDFDFSLPSNPKTLFSSEANWFCCMLTFKGGQPVSEIQLYSQTQLELRRLEGVCVGEREQHSEISCSLVKTFASSVFHCPEEMKAVACEVQLSSARGQ